MGSLVISQVATDITHDPYTTMRRGEAHRTTETDSTPRSSRSEHHPQTASSSFASANSRSTSRDRPAPPPSSFLPPENASSHARSGNATPVPSNHQSNRVHSDQSQMSLPHPSQFPSSQSSQSSQYVNQHPHGFDQSGFPLSSTPRGLASSSPNSPRLQPTYRSARSLGGSEATSPSRIKVRDLSHIQSFASEELLTRPRVPRVGSGYGDAGRQYEISSMPVTDIIEMVAGLLTKITTTNDQQHEHLHRPIPPPEGTPGLSQQTTSVLAFHGKNVPSITILSYLSRIHKYCPTTYEVFLSLLVYFDRMTEMVNSGFMHSMRQRTIPTPSHQNSEQPPSASIPPGMEEEATSNSQSAVATPPSSTPMEATDPAPGHSSIPQSPMLPEDHSNLAHFFVVDSFNIHRLVIAGVTCASKFFSDVFYTNSRYAKVRSF